MSRPGWFIGCVLLVAVSCAAPSDEATDSGLDTDAMIFRRADGARRVDKTAWLNGDTVRAGYAIDSAGMEIEPLRVLEQLNKPAFRSSYTDTVYGSATSNLQVRELQARDSSASVRRLRVYYPASTGVPLRMDAQIVRDNLLFSKRELLEIRFDLTGNRLDRYYLSGVQKTIFSAPVTYGAGVEFYY